MCIRDRGEHYNKIATVAHTLSEVLECHHVTGQDSYMIKVIVSSMVHLEHVISQMRKYGETTTSIVLSSPVKGKMIAAGPSVRVGPVSYTHLRAHETPEHLVCRLLLEKKKKKN
eukprot:TRINITY_DN49410_c0_g1_i1.p1 TRINITY_DN49410_c0_g1~~TRINITY_DN49410_c0_g1_i1.p1  ORF type:complete len:114 (-),score=41.08 TRINITY_DN49410_c0_g1_i1:120-461(-)